MKYEDVTDIGLSQKIIEEGISNANLIYIMTGHCKITKRIIDDQVCKSELSTAINYSGRQRSKHANFLLHFNLIDIRKTMSSESNMLLISGLCISSETIFLFLTWVYRYRGACIDPESVLDRKPTSCTAIAMCNMDIVFIDASTNIYNNDPRTSEASLAELQD
eukprot:762444-Hanusia_phi.AAC.2